MDSPDSALNVRSVFDPQSSVGAHIETVVNIPTGAVATDGDRGGEIRIANTGVV